MSNNTFVRNADSNLAKPIYIAGASYQAAKFACLNWHYAKRMPASKLNRFGVWEFGKFIGVVIFGRGSSGVGSLFKTFSLEKYEICELQRIALTSHRTEVTRIISICLKLLKAKNPGLALVISYADPKVGHKGTIYQAANWIPWGMSAADRSFKFFDGSVRHSRAVSKSGRKNLFGKYTKVPRERDAVEITELPPKHRFLYALNDRGNEAIARAKQAMIESHSKQRRGSTDPHAPKKDKKRGRVLPAPSSSHPA